MTADVINGSFVPYKCEPPGTKDRISICDRLEQSKGSPYWIQGPSMHKSSPFLWCQSKFPYKFKTVPYTAEYTVLLLYAQKNTIRYS